MGTGPLTTRLLPHLTIIRDRHGNPRGSSTETSPETKPKREQKRRIRK